MNVLPYATLTAQVKENPARNSVVACALVESPQVKNILGIIIASITAQGSYQEETQALAETYGILARRKISLNAAAGRGLLLRLILGPELHRAGVHFNGGFSGP